MKQNNIIYLNYLCVRSLKTIFYPNGEYDESLI